jgi:hypothetical protein
MGDVDLVFKGVFNDDGDDDDTFIDNTNINNNGVGGGASAFQGTFGFLGMTGHGSFNLQRILDPSSLDARVASAVGMAEFGIMSSLNDGLDLGYNQAQAHYNNAHGHGGSGGFGGPGVYSYGNGGVGGSGGGSTGYGNGSAPFAGVVTTLPPHARAHGSRGGIGGRGRCTSNAGVTRNVGVDDDRSVFLVGDVPGSQTPVATQAPVAVVSGGIHGDNGGDGGDGFGAAFDSLRGDNSLGFGLGAVISAHGGGGGGVGVGGSLYNGNNNGGSGGYGAWHPNSAVATADGVGGAGSGFGGDAAVTLTFGARNLVRIATVTV